MEEAYTRLKPLLTSLAYRMLGSWTDAEDVVQEAFVSLGESPPEHIVNTKAYLCKIVTNACIDRLKSPSKQRVTYVGSWLPEPIITGRPDSNDPLDRYVAKESVSTAFLLMLQQLSAPERAVFLLREVLQYEYDEIAEIVGKSSAACRQLFHRAKAHIGYVRESKVAIGENTQGLVDKFAQALVSANLPQLLNVISPETVLYMDGGGRIRAPLRAVSGADNIARFFMAILPEAPAAAALECLEINGLPGMVARADGQAFAAFTFSFRNGQISEIYAVVNPEKLTHLGA